MNKIKKIDVLGVVTVPKFIGGISQEEAYAMEGLNLSRLFVQIFVQGEMELMPAKEIYGHRAVGLVDHSDLLKWREDFSPLVSSDIWRLFRTRNMDVRVKLRDDGSHNVLFVSSTNGNLWYVDIFKSRSSGWKADLLSKEDLCYGELIFSGPVKENARK